MASRSTGFRRLQKTLRPRLLPTQRELTRARDSINRDGSTILFVVYVGDGSFYEFVVSGSFTVYLPVRNGAADWLLV